MQKIVIFGEALTYPPKEGITAHVFSTLEELAKQPNIEPVLVMADRGFFDIARLDDKPWTTVVVPPEAFYDVDQMYDIVAALQPDAMQSYNVYQGRIVGAPLAAKLEIPFVFEHHDLETELSTFLGLPETLAADNRRYQQELLYFASLNRVMSRHDYELLATRYRQEAAVMSSLTWLPVSQSDAFGPELGRETPNNGVLFVGNGGYPPNAQAIAFILDELAPAHPELQFHIIGRLTDELCQNYQGTNVSAYGQVDDLRPIAAQCFVGIIPIVAGSGMKVKVLTYLSAGLPVIGSDVAFHGYGAPDVLLQAETVSDYDKQFAALLQNKAWRVLGRQARQIFETSFDSAAIAERLVQAYQSLPGHITASDRPALPPIARDDQRLAWIHEVRDGQYTPVSNVVYKGQPTCM